MRMSKRISSFQCSPIRRLVPFAREAKENGIHVVHLNIGQPDIKTPAEALAAIHNYPEATIAYGLSEGEVGIRKALLKYYRKYGIYGLSDSDILITTGGSEAIQFTILTLCDPGDEIIIPEPYYTNVATFSNIAMVDLIPVTSSIDDGFSLPPISSFREKIGPKTRGILLCSPNNPTGHVYTRRELVDLLTLCKEKDIFLIVDEVYREFCYDGEDFVSVLTFPEFQDRVICVDSFSKRFSMCGARIGALVSRNKEVISNALKLAQARLCPPAVEESAAEAALSAPDEYILGVKKEYEERRNFFFDKVSKIKGVKCFLPKGAFYFVAELPIEDAEDFAIFMLKEFSYNGSTLMFAPAEDFYVTKGLGRNQVRLAYVLCKDELEIAATCLEKGLEAYKGRKHSSEHV